MSDFPPASLVGKENSAAHVISKEDPAIRTKMEGGYVYTRPRHTRRPRRTFATGFTHITEAQRADLETFYDSVFGGSNSFTYTPPTLGIEVIVRFKAPIDFKYSGAGTNYRWDVDNIQLEEV